MFTAFGIYNEIHTAKPANITVKEPLSTNKNDKIGSKKNGGRFYPRWLVGMAVLGDYDLNGIELDYIIQVSNGEQGITNPYEEDDNTQKAISGRLRAVPIQDLQLGLSFYSDKISELIGADDSGARTKLSSYSFFTTWTPGEFGVEFEYVAGSYAPSNKSAINRYGLSLMGTYNVTDYLTPYIRYEFLDPNKAVDDDNASVLIYGLNVQVTTGLFLKFEIDSYSGGKNNNVFKGTKANEFKFSSSIGF